MQASHTQLQSIIDGTKQYVVPLFQREYSWTEKEWKILWNDVVELCEMDSPRDHFIGSIVTMQTVSVPEGVPKYLLIDGQQRLTTIFIMLMVMRDTAEEIGETNFAEEINNTILVNAYKKDSLDYYKILPTHSDREVFQALIRKNSMTGPELIFKAYQYFYKIFHKNKMDVHKIKKIITNHFSVVSIVLGQDDNPHLVFESLNAKGRPLTQADLIRNFFFMRIHIDEQNEIYKKYWEPMQFGLQDKLTEFIRHYLMKFGSMVRETEVYFALKDRVNGKNVMDSLQELTVFSKYYQKMMCPELEENPSIKNAFKKLQKLDITTTFPFLLNCYHDYQSSKITAEDFSQILATLENFLMRRFVCNVSTNQLNKIFPVLYSQVMKGTLGSFTDKVRNILQSRGYPKDIEFKTRILDAKMYGSGDRAIKAKFILDTIEESYNHKEKITLVDLQIEHIMPQTLSESWQAHLGEGWETAHELLLHTIGNLTLTGYNSKLSNDDFESKKDIYADSHLEMNKYFDNVCSWKREDIEQRSNELAEVLLKIWPYFGEETTHTSESIRVTNTTPTNLCILGQNFTVGSWRDVIEQIINTIAELEPEKFEDVLIQFPKLVGKEKDKFRAIRQLKNGAYIEVNLSAQDIYKYCLQLLQAIDLTENDWYVKTIAN